jgi:small subunit ribosomal protein S6
METIINEYELTLIVRPDLTEDVHTRIVEKLTEIMERFGGSLFFTDPWGRQKLAYPIQKHNHGYYLYISYVGPSALPHELERIIRLDDNIIRFLTVRLDEQILDVDSNREDALARHQQWVERRSVIDHAPRR